MGTYPHTAALSLPARCRLDQSAEIPALVQPSVRAVRFVRQMRGRTEPCLLGCDDDQYYVVKSRRGCVRERALAAEMFASFLGTLLGLPVPTPVSVLVPRPLWPTGLHDRSSSIDGMDRTDDLCFGSLYAGTIPGPPVVDFFPAKLLWRVKNLREACLGGLVFDLWTHNRGRRKMIFRRVGPADSDPYMAMLVNHDECFGRDWFHSVASRRDYPCLQPKAFALAQSVDSFEPFLSRIERFPASWLEQCARAVPREWCGRTPSGISRVVKVLLGRRMGLRQALTEAIGHRRSTECCPEFSSRAAGPRFAGYGKVS
jgi:hypothetical protein